MGLNQPGATSPFAEHDFYNFPKPTAASTDQQEDQQQEHHPERLHPCGTDGGDRDCWHLERCGVAELSESVGQSQRSRSQLHDLSHPKKCPS